MTTETAQVEAKEEVKAAVKKVTKAKATATAKAKETVEKAAAESTSMANKATDMIRSVAYAYVGTIAKSIDAMDSLYKQLKDDRSAMFNELVNSGESFVADYRSKATEYRSKATEQTEEMVNKVKTKLHLKAEKRSEQEAA